MSTEERRPRSRRIRTGEARYGWLFTLPAILIVGVFLVLPIGLALWVSVSDWNGLGSPIGGTASFVGLENYSEVLVEEGRVQRVFGETIRNNMYYVLLVVPLQTALALFLAVQVNRRVLRGKGFFRTAFYFPSVTSSVAITVIFMFLFSASGAINQVLAWFGANGPNWFNEPTGLIHGLLRSFGITQAPEALAGPGPLGITWWDWLAGPSVAMTVLIIMAVFTTGGTFMLLFLAALQNIGQEIDEAALIDGAGPWRKFFSVTLPMLKPTLFTVLTLGLIGTWQVFDQVYLTSNFTSSASTLTTPAYLAYTTSFDELRWGRGAAIAFILFAIIVVLTLLQRFILRDKDATGTRSERKAARAAARRDRSGGGGADARLAAAEGPGVPAQLPPGIVADAGPAVKGEGR